MTREQQYVTAIFDTIAPRYDQFTRVFSFGMDAKWKRTLLSSLASSRDTLPNGDVLDLASGTGDFARALAKLFPERKVVGVDASPKMVEAAIQHSAPANVIFSVGDMMQLSAARNSIAVAAAGYAFRNTPDYRVALREIAACLKPDGILVVLDFYQPRSRLWRFLFVNYLRVAGNVVGWLWHKSPEVYGYIADSIERYVNARTFESEANRVGLVVLQRVDWLRGGVVGHLLRKSSNH